MESVVKNYLIHIEDCSFMVYLVVTASGYEKYDNIKYKLIGSSKEFRDLPQVFITNDLIRKIDMEILKLEL